VTGWVLLAIIMSNLPCSSEFRDEQRGRYAGSGQVVAPYELTVDPA